MKKLTFNSGQKLVLLVVLCAIQLIAWSQDAVSHSSTTVTTKTNNSFQVEPWMWIVGGAVLLVILVALLRGNSNKDVSTTTVIKKDTI